MTNEQKTFISFGDVVALEFRCKNCGSSVRRPLSDWRQPPGMCGNCREQWLSDGGERHRFLNDAVNTLNRLAAPDEDAKYILRAEITQVAERG